MPRPEATLCWEGFRLFSKQRLIVFWMRSSPVKFGVHLTPDVVVAVPDASRFSTLEKRRGAGIKHFSFAPPSSLPGGHCGAAAVGREPAGCGRLLHRARVHAASRI